MNKVLLRFKIIATNEIIEVYFDIRLSFKENFNLLTSLKKIQFHYIYEPSKQLFLKDDIAIAYFNLPNLMLLYLL